MSINNSIVTAKNVSFNYGGQSVLQDVSFDIKKGDYVGMVGSNGSGKTTLLKILLGLLTPIEGEVELFGTTLRNFGEWGKVGYVPQNVFRGDLNFPATVREVVESGHLEVSKRKRILSQFGKNDEIQKALQRAGIEHLSKKRIGELSGGERQKVFIARALVSNPELIVLDEPTTGIDAATEEKFYTFLEDLNHSGITILLVSHDIEAIARQVKTVLCLNRRLICFGKPESLQQPEVLKAMYGGEKQMLHHEHKH